MVVIEILYNLLALVGVSVLAGLIKRDHGPFWYYQLWQGFLFGAASVLGMLHPLVLSQGLIFDGRSVVISLCGVFFGPMAALIAGGMAIICRVWQGGAGLVHGRVRYLVLGIIGRQLLSFKVQDHSCQALGVWAGGASGHALLHIVIARDHEAACF